MNKTWINVTGTAVTGWAEGPEAPADGWFNYSWRPEKSLAAYEYLEIMETVTEPDPDPEAEEGATISIEVSRGFNVRQRADWEDDPE